MPLYLSLLLQLPVNYECQELIKFTLDLLLISKSQGVFILQIVKNISELLATLLVCLLATRLASRLAILLVSVTVSASYSASFCFPQTSQFTECSNIPFFDTREGRAR